jgi:hypothetical protein
LPQARDDPVGVGYLCTAKPENIGRASHLLFHGSAIFLRPSRGCNTAGGGYRKTQENSVRSHIRSFLWIGVHDRSGKPVCSRFKINEAEEGSPRTTKCEAGFFALADRIIPAHVQLSALFVPADRRRPEPGK